MRLFAFLSAVWLLVWGVMDAKQVDPKPPLDLDAAVRAMDAGAVDSIEFTAAGASYFVGQSPTPDEPWPIVPVRHYSAAVDYNTGSMRVERINVMDSAMPRGGGLPFRGEQRVLQFVSGEDAWNVLQLPSSTAPTGPLLAGGGGAVPGQPMPASGLAVERMLQIWATPHGFLRGAVANKAVVRSTREGTEVSFKIQQKYSMVGILDPRGQVSRVRTWIDSPVVGDMPVETTYSGYRDFDGVRFPSRIVQVVGGHPSMDLTVFDVQTNSKIDVPIPPGVREARLASKGAMAMVVKTVAPGVHFLTGGWQNSVAIEMRDHVVVLEAGSEPRAWSVIARMKELAPGKPIRYVVNTHHHFDHSAGLRAYAAAGATIVTHEQNKAFFERVLALPRTLGSVGPLPSAARPRIRAVADRAELTDGFRTIELHLVGQLDHAGGMLFAYLPRERLLFEADAYTPPMPPAERLPPAEIPMARPLYETIRRLKLDVGFILTNHGPGEPITLESLVRAMGHTTN